MAKKIALDNDLSSILLTDGFDNFTVLELRSAYLARVDNPALDKVEARRYVYRHILRLEKYGLLVRKESTKKDRTYYSKTAELSPDRFNSHNEQASAPKETTRSDRHELRQQLHEKLNRYRSELLMALGETEEYKSLHQEFPDLTHELQEQYNSARDHCSKIHGRIKAIENLMTTSSAAGSDSAAA